MAIKQSKTLLSNVVYLDKKEAREEISSAIDKIYCKALADRNSKSEHFEKSLYSIMVDCHNERRGILSDDERAIADEMCHIGLDFGRRKAVQAKALIDDVVRFSIDQPIYEPSNVPELPKSAEKEVLASVYDQILQTGFTGGLSKDLIKPLKLEALAKYKAEAQKKATLVEQHIRDQLEQMDYDNEMSKVIDDLVSMPFCAANYPCYEYKQTPKWVEDKWVVEEKLVGRMKRISPFDIFLVSGNEPKRCAAVLQRDTVHSSALEKMLGKEGWIDDAIERVLDSTTPEQVIEQSYSRNIENKHGIKDSSTIEYYKFYGKLPRKLFEKSGLMLDSGTSRSVEVIVFVKGKEIIYFKQQRENSEEFRPFYLTSYEKINGSYAGIGVLQRVSKVAKIARAMTYAAIRNAAYTAKPTGEMDYSRLKQFNKEEDLKSLSIGTLLATEPDLTGKQGGFSPAIHLYDIPNHMGQYQAALTYFLELLDQLSDVPRISAGQGQGLATFGRSHRGLAMLVAGESKSVKAVLQNFDFDISEPIFLAMYNELMADTKNPNLKGDIRCRARGTSGYVGREAKAAARQEGLQFLAPYAQEIPPELRAELLRGVLMDMGVDVERFDKKTASVANPETNNIQTTSPGYGGEKTQV